MLHYRPVLKLVKMELPIWLVVASKIHISSMIFHEDASHVLAITPPRRYKTHWFIQKYEYECS